MTKMDENNFWITVLRTVGTVASLLMLTICGCTVHSNMMVAAMVEAGADPIKARCAIKGIDGNGEAAICGAAASSGAKQ